MKMMMNRAGYWLIAVVFLGLGRPLSAAERVALVIGNDAYQHTGKLDNCVNDARAVGAVLKGAGFSVVEGYDLTTEGMHGKLDEFQRAAAGSKVGLFFYAGHGMEDERKNLLVPVDAELVRKTQLPVQTVGVDKVLEKFAAARVPAKILLLDCCRNMPLGRGWRVTRGDQGLAEVDRASLPEGTVMLFATAPGAVASDAGQSGKHSPFTEGLLQKLAVPGIHAYEALMQVEDVVHEQTKGSQRPKLFSDGETKLFRELFFAKNAGGLGESATVVRPSPADASAIAFRAIGKWRITERVTKEQGGWVIEWDYDAAIVGNMIVFTGRKARVNGQQATPGELAAVSTLRFPLGGTEVDGSGEEVNHRGERLRSVLGASFKAGHEAFNGTCKVGGVLVSTLSGEFLGTRPVSPAAPAPGTDGQSALVGKWRVVEKVASSQGGWTIVWDYDAALSGGKVIFSGKKVRVNENKPTAGEAAAVSTLAFQVEGLTAVGKADEVNQRGDRIRSEVSIRFDAGLNSFSGSCVVGGEVVATLSGSKQ